MQEMSYVALSGSCNKLCIIQRFWRYGRGLDLIGKYFTVALNLKSVFVV